MKFFTVAVVSIMCMALIAGPVCATIGASNVAQVVVGPWTGAGKATAVGVRVATGLKWVRAVTGWAGIAAIAGSLAIEYIPAMQAKWFEWIGLHGDISILGGLYKIHMEEHLDSYVEGEIGPKVAYYESLGYAVTVMRYASSEEGSTAFGAYRDSHPSWSYANNCMTYHCYAIVFDDPAPGPLVYFAWGKAGHNTLTPASDTPVTANDISTRMEADLNGSNGSQAQAKAKEVWEAHEAELAKSVNGEAHETGVDTQKNAYKQRLYTDIGQQAQTELNNQPEPTAGEDASTDEAVEESTWITRMITALKTAFGLDKSGSVTNTTVPADENTSIIDQAGADTAETAQKEITETKLGLLKSAFSGLRDKIMTRMNAILPTGEGVCSLSTSFLNKTVTIGWCDFDFAVIRGIVIGLGCIAACFILFM